MPVQAVTTTQPQTIYGHSHQFVWAAMANGDSGAPVSVPNEADRSIQFTGTFGAGGTVLMEGSNDGVTYFTLTDPSNTAISATAAALKQITEETLWLRPRVTAGDGTTAIIATLITRGSV